MYHVSGVNGQINLTKNRVIISRKGLLGFAAQGLSGNKEIPIKSITAVQFKEATGLTNGFIQFSILGGVEGKRGALAATQDENTVMFSAKQAAHFHEIKRYVDSVIDEEPVDFGSLQLPQAEGAVQAPAAPASEEVASVAPTPTVPSAEGVVAAPSVQPVIATHAKPPKKPIYKRWWFVTIVALFIIGLLMPKDPKPTTTTPSSSPDVVVPAASEPSLGTLSHFKSMFDLDWDHSPLKDGRDRWMGSDKSTGSTLECIGDRDAIKQVSLLAAASGESGAMLGVLLSDVAPGAVTWVKEHVSTGGETIIDGKRISITTINLSDGALVTVTVEVI